MSASDEYDAYAVRQPGRDRVGKTLRPDAEVDGDGEASGPQTVAAGRLRFLIERVERLEEEKSTINDDIKEVFAEGKADGFDTKAMRALIRLRKKDPAERAEEEAILDLYKSALGMV
jgi:uncharacterized protein (UPF0335 family)